MEMENQLWGEIPEPRNTEWDRVVPKEIGKLVILSAIKPELPKIKQPQPEEDLDQLITVGPEHSTMEENVLYTIKLLKHSREVSELIRIANSVEEDKTTEIKDCPKLPTPPTTETKFHESFSFRNVAKDDRPFTLGEPISVPHLGREVTKEILYKAVATICAHTGFESAMQSSLQVLTDVAEDFFRKFTRLLRYAVDHEELHGNSGFPDAMERVFHEMGFGSMLSLHDFYQTRVLLYRDQCLARSVALMAQYQAVLPNVKREPEETIRFKTEMEIEEDIPELHFPATAEDCVDELQSSLEPGFQMLHSLEQEVHFTTVLRILLSAQRLPISMEQDEEYNILLEQCDNDKKKTISEMSGKGRDVQAWKFSEVLT